MPIQIALLIASAIHDGDSFKYTTLNFSAIPFFERCMESSDVVVQQNATYGLAQCYLFSYDRKMACELYEKAFQM